uniref:Uncharacterized protein n=1 Tax=Micrurus spixii TaxID=129469 RepID=A0A2D4N871_9SAUR
MENGLSKKFVYLQQSNLFLLPRPDQDWEVGLEEDLNLSFCHFPAKADFGSQVGFLIATQIVTKKSDWMKKCILKGSVNFSCSWAQTVKTGSLTNLGSFFF